MATIVTGGAGFVAANLIGRLLNEGHQVIAIDNLSRGSTDHLKSYLFNEKFQFEQLNIADLEGYKALVSKYRSSTGIRSIWHLAANSDIPAGIADASVDFRDTFLTTFNTLEVSKAFGIKEIYFASSSAIYGDLGSRKLTENSGPLLPISNYGAMKLASEAIISAAVESHDIRALIFRFPNVVGVPATHGVILDFIRKLKINPTRLDVLGDGTQRKAYLHVSDLVDAMIFLSKRNKKIEIFNIGPIDSGVNVSTIAYETISAIAPDAKIYFGIENRGWIGDVPRFHYSIENLMAVGWRPKLDSLEAIQRAIKEIKIQEA